MIDKREWNSLGNKFPGIIEYISGIIRKSRFKYETEDCKLYHELTDIDQAKKYKKIIVDVCFESNKESREIEEEINDTLQVQRIEVNDLEKLFIILDSLRIRPNLIIFDVENINKKGEIDALELIHVVHALFASETPERHRVPLAVLGDLNIDRKLLDFISVTSKLILGIVPRGPDFTLVEKRMAIIKLMHKGRAIHEKFNKLLLEDKPREFEVKEEPKETNKLENNLEHNNSIKLSERQQDILNLVLDRGASNKLIAKMLHISESTVKVHMSAIFKKYGVTNRTQLAVCARTSANNKK